MDSQESAIFTLPKWFNWPLFLSALTLVVAISITLSLFTNPRFFPIRRVTITGHYPVCEKPLIKRLLLPVVTGNFFSLSLTAIQKRLMSLSWVANVSVRRIWPSRLLITIFQQQPVAHFNQQQWLNQQGDVFQLPGYKAQTPLPYLNGPNDQSKQLLTMYFQLQKQLQTIGQGIKRLSLSSRQAWRMQLNNGMLVRLGQNAIMLRLQRFINLYPKLFKGHVKQINYVDLRYTNGLAVSWKQHLEKTIAVKLRTA